MNLQDAAFIVAGAIGSGVAVVHGIVTQRLMARPLQKAAVAPIAPRITTLAALLLHFTTFSWFLGGLALLLAAFAVGREGRLATGLLVGSSYLFGALVNLYASRGRHPGWVLYAAALLLIPYGLGD